MTVTSEKILFANLDRVTADAVAIRHELHRYPELSYQEVSTSTFICKQLEKLKIEYFSKLAGGTGILAVIQGTKGPATGCVALRADMDALPIQELTGLPYASKKPGLMHACGHDGHMAVLLGTAAILNENRQHFAGTIKLLFQPAEEGGCGALKMVEDGVLENPKVEAIFGLHGWPGLKVGMVATRPGPLLAAVDGFMIRITGRGGHAAAPHTAIDPIVCAAALIQAIQSIVSRETDPTDSTVLTIAQINAGSAFNIIPDKAELHGTLRTLSQTHREAVLSSLERLSQGIAQAHRCEASIQYFGATPCTNNTPAQAAFMRETALRVLGDRGYVEASKPAMWGEDFAFYLERVPGCFFVLGVQPHDRDDYPMLHHPLYDFTDAAVPVGIRMMVELALGHLARGTTNNTR